MSDDKTRVLDLLADGLGHGFDCAKIRHALAEVIEAHKVVPISNPTTCADTWRCQGCTWQKYEWHIHPIDAVPDCPNMLRAVAIAAAHLLPREDVTT